jgi:hypothetical protein
VGVIQIDDNDFGADFFYRFPGDNQMLPVYQKLTKFPRLGR